MEYIRMKKESGTKRMLNKFRQSKKEEMKNFIA